MNNEAYGVVSFLFTLCLGWWTGGKIIQLRDHLRQDGVSPVHERHIVFVVTISAFALLFAANIIFQRLFVQ